MTTPTNLTFTPALHNLDGEYPELVEVVLRIAREPDIGTVKVFTCDREEYTDLEWVVNTTSPSGRRTIDLLQRVRGGPVVERRPAPSGLVYSPDASEVR
jgi:hypothetical protein